MDKIEHRLSEMSIINNDVYSIDTKWGWPLKDLYRKALNFYKGKKKNSTKQNNNQSNSIDKSNTKNRFFKQF